jgi:uncharacterized protein with PIN domain
MIVDTSALVAILRHEPEREKFAQTLDKAVILRISAATYLVQRARFNPTAFRRSA